MGQPPARQETDDVALGRQDAPQLNQQPLQIEGPLHQLLVGPLGEDALLERFDLVVEALEQRKVLVDQGVGQEIGQVVDPRPEGSLRVGRQAAAHEHRWRQRPARAR